MKKGRMRKKILEKAFPLLKNANKILENGIGIEKFRFATAKSRDIQELLATPGVYEKYQKIKNRFRGKMVIWNEYQENLKNCNSLKTS